MPRTLTSPSGRTYTWDKATDPTEADIAEIVAYDASLGEAPSAPTGRPDPMARAMRDPANQPVRDEKPLMQRFGDAMGQMGDPQTGLIPQRTPELQVTYDAGLGKGLKRGGEAAILLAPAFIPGAGAATVPSALARLGLNAAIRGTGGVAAGSTVRAMEGEPTKLSDAAKDFVSYGLGVPQAKAAPLLSLETAKNVARMGGAQAGTVLAANAAEQALDGKPMSWDRYKESAKEAYLPAAIGAVSGLGIGKLQQMAKVQSEADAGRLAAAELGMADPVLGDVLPKYAKMQQEVNASNPAIKAAQDKARSPIVKAMLGIVGGTVKNEELATELQPMIGKMDALDAQYGAAQQRLEAAQEAIKVAKAKTDLTPEARASIIKGAQAETMTAIQEQAKANIALIAQADAIGTQTGHAEAVQDIVRKTFGARSQIAQDMMAATGIPQEAAIIGQSELLAAATKALGDDANTVAGKSILETIKNWGSKGAQDAAATQQLSLEQMAQKAASQGKTNVTAEEWRAMFGGSQPQTPIADQKYLTLDDFRRLRDGISEGFYGKVDSNAMNNAERMAGKAYAAMSDAHVGEIAKQFPDAVGPYNQFRAFWRDTSKLRDSDFGRALLRGEVSDSTIGAMAGKLASGQEDEVRNFKRFVDVIREQNPAVADAAMATMGSAVGNSFRQAAYDAASGGTNYLKLGNMLQSYSSKKDATFPVELFRMGDAKTIAGWQKALREFKPEELTPSAIRSVMESPQIQSVLQTGGKDMPAQLSKAYATVAFTKRVNDAVAMQEAGMMREARSAFVDANRLATKAGIDAKTAQAAVQEAQANPLNSVFRGKGGYRLTNEAEKIEGQGTITDLVNNMKGEEIRGFMGKLRSDKPDLAEMVERRLLANAMQKMVGSEGNVPGELYRVKATDIRKFFTPSPGNTDTELAKLSNAIGAEKMSRFRSFAEGIAKLDDAERTGKIAAGMPNDLVEGLRFGATAATGSVQAGSSRASILQRGLNWLNERRYNLLSAALLDDGWMNAVNRSSGDIAEALGSLPAQKSYLLLQDARILNEIGSDKNNDKKNTRP